MSLGKLPLYKFLNYFLIDWLLIEILHILQERVLQGQKVQQLKHNWLEPKQMMRVLWFLRKNTTKQTKKKPTLFVSSWDTQNTGTGKQKALCTKYGWRAMVTPQEVKSIMFSLTNRLISNGFPSLPLTASVSTLALMVLHSLIGRSSVSCDGCFPTSWTIYALGH